MRRRRVCVFGQLALFVLFINYFFLFACWKLRNFYQVKIIEHELDSSCSRYERSRDQGPESRK